MNPYIILLIALSLSYFFIPKRGGRDIFLQSPNDDVQNDEEKDITFVEKKLGKSIDSVIFEFGQHRLNIDSCGF